MNNNFEGALALLREDKKRLKEMLDMKDLVIQAQAKRIGELEAEAADRIEQLERELAGIRAELDPQPSDEWPTYMAVRAMSTAHAAEKALADDLAGAFTIGPNGGVIMRPSKVKIALAAYRKARGL